MPLLTHHRVEENIGLVRMVIKRYRGFGVDEEDLMQIGSIGLIKAVRDFDESKQVQFSTYAVSKIIGEIKTYLRDNGSIKISRRYKEDKLRIDRACRELTQTLGREPKLSEIADFTGLSPEDILTATEATQPTVSLDLPPEEGGVTPNVESPEEDALNRVLTAEMLKFLPPTERKLIVMRYFKEMTQEKIAKELGLSQVAVSRLEKKILATLRDRFG